MICQKLLKMKKVNLPLPIRLTTTLIIQKVEPKIKTKSLRKLVIKLIAKHLLLRMLMKRMVT